MNEQNIKHQARGHGLVVIALLAAMGAACVDEAEDLPTIDPVQEPDDAYGGKADSAGDRVMPRGPAPAPFPNQLTLFAIPSPRPAELSWDNPGTLVRRVLFNQLGVMSGLGFDRALGHAGVRVDCARPSGGTVSFQGSMTNVDGGQFNELLLQDKIGLGMLFDDVDGRIERAEELEETLQQRYKNGRVSFLRIGISAETCAGLLAYAAAYEQANVQRNYGLAARPLHREGAGCSAYSMAFLELANLIEPDHVAAWSFSVRAPKALVGGSRNPDNQVSLWRLVTLTRPWAGPEEAGFHIFGWDPTLMFHSIRALAEADVRAGGHRAEARGRAIGLVLDRTDVTPRAELTARTFFAP